MEITVSGTGRSSLRPERATLHLTAGFESGDKAEAMSEATRVVNELSADLRRLKELDPSPTTWSAVLPIGTRSWRPWSDQGAILPMRHAASARIMVKFRNFPTLAGFADHWGGRPGVTLGHIEWTLTETRQKETERSVLAQAVEVARERAQVLATAAGAGEVRCLEVSDPGMLGHRTEGEPMMLAASRSAYAKDAGGGGEGIEIAPEDVDIEATVHARFTAD
ncbi:MAG: SIMPL domain-containing protein [Tetrasphaera sp.]|nr:SIMPL domain-containing protein [Tetrasphaera sp.]